MSQKLTLREYTAGFLLISMVFGAAMAFSGSIFTIYDTDLQGEQGDVKKLNQEIKDSAPDTGTGNDKVNSISTEDSGSFFLSSVLTVVETVTNGLGSVRAMGSTFVENLNFWHGIAALFSIPVIAVVWEVVSLYRGIRT